MSGEDDCALSFGERALTSAPNLPKLRFRLQRAEARMGADKIKGQGELIVGDVSVPAGYDMTLRTQAPDKTERAGFTQMNRSYSTP